MRTGTIPTISKMIFLCMLSVLGGSTVALEEASSSSGHNQHLNPVMNDMNFEEPAEKRAYTYVSEYKRLPVYNFGLGKRWVDNSDDKRARSYSFGLGKRTRQYSFGLGKRNDNQEYYPFRMEYLPFEGYESYRPREDAVDEMLEDKRSNRLYSFGLGKRSWNMVDQGGKRPSDVIGQRYLFDSSKRISEDDEASQ